METVVDPPEPVKMPSPLYSADTAPLPTASTDPVTLMDAAPVLPDAASDAVPAVVPLTRNSTLPVGAVPPEPADTVAVSCTVSLRPAATGLAANVVVLAVPLFHSI